MITYGQSEPSALDMRIGEAIDRVQVEILRLELGDAEA